MQNSKSVANNEGIVFSEDEEEYEPQRDTINNEIAMKLQENVESIVRTFKEFLSTPTFINNVGDKTTNIIDRYSKKCYCIPDRKIPKFFKFLEITRRKKLKMMLYEKQSEYSGIMLDFDIKINHGGSDIGQTQYHRLCISVIKVLMKYLHFSEDEIGQTRNIYVGFIKKPKIVYDNETDSYKDGLHMLIPGIQITRALKKHIINTLIEDGALEKVFKEIIPHSSMSRSEFLDVNSAHVGVFYVGSASKINSPPYDFADVYRVQTTIGELDDIIPIKIPNFSDNGTEEGTNICYEFSLNWMKNPEKGGIIEKRRYDIQSKYQHLIDQYKAKPNEDEEVDGENDNYYNEMSILNLHDPDMEYIKLLLDILHEKRSEDYALWFDVLCALAHTSPSYKPLGEYFSRKCPEKFDHVNFDKVWESILTQKSNRLSIGSIHYWAKNDNPDRYEEVRQRSIFTLLYKKIYDPQVEGNLEHYDIAEILFQVLKNKYVYDKAFGVSTWYEFVLENEPMKVGEMYKWRSYNDRPNSIMKYISTILPNLFRKVLDRIKTTLDECNTDLSKYHYQIYKNFQKSCRQLKNSGFKRAVGTECEQLFERMGFSEELDNDPDLKGVANGIMKLGTKCKLIQGYHGHLVSKYTKARFKPMNPRDKITAKVLTALRNLFPDCEPDTFDYIMHYLSSTLDGHKKESIMMLLVGKGSNGKSFLVELHKGAIGEIYGVKMPLSFLTSRSKDAESATPALMQLKDAHFAYYSESNKFEILNMAKIKEFTGQETLAGRKLHSDYVNFKPKCHHLVASNNDFEINGTDHGTWRRIDYVTMKIKFCALSTDAYDPTNPYERVADPSLGSKWADDEDTLEAYLGILAYYYESLQTNYDGKVRNVPHPHVRKETEEFRSRQDKVNNFLNMTLVKCEDDDSETPMTDVIEKYNKWYESQFPGSNGEYKRHAKDQLENSKIQSFIKKTRLGNYVKGYRILGVGEVKTDDEEYYIDLFEKKNLNALHIKPENAKEYVERLCREYDGVVQEPIIVLKDNDIKNDDTDSDSDIEELVRDNHKREPTKTFKVVNKEVLNLDSIGIKIPKKKYIATPNFSVSDLKEFAMMGNHIDIENIDEESEDTDSD
jgi:phage/plasmid-associated DNA primase